MRARAATESEAMLTHLARLGDILPAPDTEQFNCAHCNALLAAPAGDCFNLTLAFICPVCQHPSVGI